MPKYHIIYYQPDYAVILQRVEIILNTEREAREYFTKNYPKKKIGGIKKGEPHTKAEIDRIKQSLR
jgi:hypothetical protein